MPKFTAARVAEIRGHLRAFEARSISMAAFAREIGVTPLTVRNWRRRFGSGTRGGRRQPVDVELCERADLIEVQRAASSSLSSPMSTPIEIAIAGFIIRVPAGADDTALRAVLRAVRSC
jgi:transposase-like protein